MMLRLVNFIKSNLGKNNIFMIFGSLNNNLQHLIKENFPAVKFEIKKYKRSFLVAHQKEQSGIA